RHAVELLVDELPDAPFEGGDPLGCEGSAHEAAQPRVFRRVLHEHRMLLAAPPSQEPHLGVGHPEPLGRPARAAPAAGVEEYQATVVVAAQVQDTVQLTPM